jgi:Ni/Co efflux regulator RcnB
MDTRSFHRPLAIVLAAALAAGPVLAEKPEWAGQGKGHKEQKHEGKHAEKAEKHAEKAERKAAKHEAKHAARHETIRVGGYFNDGQRTVVRTYYVDHYGGGKACPPGLAKKHNGCMPPGQAKKYVVGQPLPATVRYYSVPQPVLVHLPPAPVGYRYVTVNGDILLLAIGTMMVVDALTGLLG